MPHCLGKGETGPHGLHWGILGSKKGSQTGHSSPLAMHEQYFKKSLSIAAAVSHGSQNSYRTGLKGGTGKEGIHNCAAVQFVSLHYQTSNATVIKMRHPTPHVTDEQVARDNRLPVQCQ